MNDATALAAPMPDLADLWRGPYLERLAAAWRAHIAPRAGGAPTVVSLFAGAGGSSLGYSMAGFEERLAVEWDRHACATFRANFPGVPVYQGDIAALSDAEALRLAGLRPGELDVLDGSPPCQGFSTAGKRMVDDPRNRLFREYVRMLRAFKPKALVMENVSGLVKGKMRLTFASILGELAAARYDVGARLLDAQHLGVPQSRQRVVFVGVRRGEGLGPSHPAPLGSLPISVAEAWRGVPPEGAPPLSPVYGGIALRLRPGENATKVCGPGGHMGMTFRLRWERPGRTLLRCNNGGGRGSPLHPAEHRSLSIPEAKRLASFPDEFRLDGTYAQRWARIGNSVPPLMMAAIAAHLRREVLRK